jgi:hypothetical protein
MITFDTEPYKLIYCWTVAYALVEPLVALANYVLYRKYGTKTMFQLYSKTSPLIIVACEFVYLTIIFVKTMYLYKHVLKKPTYYPQKGATKDYRDFVILFIGIMIIVEILWAFTIYIIQAHIPFLNFLNNYSRELGLYSLIRPVIFGIILLLVCDAILYHTTDLEAMGIMLFSLFAVIVASF